MQRESERESDRETERDREKERERQTERKRETDIEREKNKNSFGLNLALAHSDLYLCSLAHIQVWCV